MQLKRVTNGGIVIKYIGTVDGGPGLETQPPSNFRDFAAKKKQFLGHFNCTSDVLKAMRINKLLKFKSYFNEELNFFAALVSLTSNQVENTFKRSYFEVKSLPDLALGT